MKTFEFKIVDEHLKYKYCIPFVYYRIGFNKIKNKNLYYLILADKIKPKDHYVKLIPQDMSFGYRGLNDYFNFDWEIFELENKLMENFRYEVYKNKICFPLVECDKIIDWLESIEALNKLVG